jgi:hypothetical protein
VLLPLSGLHAHPDLEDSMRKNAPTGPVWVICLVLYVIAMLAHFRVFHIGADIATWSWIIGYGLLLAATQMRRL